MATIVATNINLLIKPIKFICMTSKMNSDMHIDVLFEILIEERKKIFFYMKYSCFSGASPKA